MKTVRVTTSVLADVYGGVFLALKIWDAAGTITGIIGSYLALVGLCANIDSRLFKTIFSKSAMIVDAWPEFVFIRSFSSKS